MGSGNTLVGADNAKSTSFRGPTDLIDRFDENLERLGYDSRSAAIVDFMSRELESIGVSPDGYLPARDDERRLYRALLQVSDDRLIYNPRRSKSQLANLADTNKDELDAGIYTSAGRGTSASSAASPGAARWPTG